MMMMMMMMMMVDDDDDVDVLGNASHCFGLLGLSLLRPLVTTTHR